MPDKEETRPPARFKVVDKRISARPDTPASPPDVSGSPLVGDSVPPETTPAPSDPVPLRPQPPGRPEQPASRPGSPKAESSEDDLWTPEQEAEARRFTDEIGQRAALEWVVNSSVTLANVAGVKLDLGQVAEASLAIDAFAAIVEKLGPRLGEVEALLRQTLAQLQLAYAERAVAPKQP